MLFDPQQVPFSRRERFLTLSMMDGTLMLRLVKGGDLRPGLGRLARIAFEDADGREAAVTLTLTPGELIARAPQAEVRFAIGANENLHVEGHGLSLVLHMEGSRYDYAYRRPDGDYCLVAAYENVRMMPRVSKGQLSVDGNWRRDRSENVTCRFSGKDGFAGTLDLFAVEPPPPTVETLAEAATSAMTEFADFAAGLPSPRSGGAMAHTLAAYILWSSTVPACGKLTRPAIFMSKNEMINIWSWDNAFSALGVAATDHALAFDQFAAIYDRQDSSGMLPDFINDRDVSFAFTKPPVHGWAICTLIAAQPSWLTVRRRTYLAEHLERQVHWWLASTREGPATLPAYPHGNDSGWDNASFFDGGGPVASPDLPTFLILCCDAMALLCPAARQTWDDRGNELLRMLLAQLATDTDFGTRRVHCATDLIHGQSLIQFMPLLLGKRLPDVLANSLMQKLAAEFLTPWGPATEAPTSPYYESDGYWRGPIWAPTTALIWDGLRSQGNHGLAQEVARRFCTLCETSGMAENFDALSGVGQRDRAFAWTSAVYLMLSADLKAIEKSDFP
ncbi:MAG: hypothetical protein WAT77_12855 [Paracoccaceae bacterium]